MPCGDAALGQPFEEVGHAVKPLLTAAAATEVADDQLVAAVREGSEEAFELLYRRYRPRIVGYVRGMVSDHARAEDIAQEAFMSALRGLRASDQEISFRPWMYEIAKNACIDHLRRARRGAEVSIDSDDFSPQEEGRISQSVSGTDAEVARRKELESLQMAFGDLPQSQHQILVMREFEGLSYDRIGSRMGLSRGAVESQLFRARRTLRDGFDDIDTGERCVRMRVTMEATADGLRTGMRERRRLSIAPARLRRLSPHGGRDRPRRPRARGSPGPRQRAAPRRRAAAAARLPAPQDGGRVAALNSMGPAAEHGASLAGKATAVVVAAALAAGGAGVATKASGGGCRCPGGLGGGSGQLPRAPAHGDGAVARGRDRRPARPRMAAARRAQAAASHAGRWRPRRAGRPRTVAGMLLGMPGAPGTSGDLGRTGENAAGAVGGAVGGAAAARSGTPGSLGGTVGSVVEGTGEVGEPNRRPGDGHGGPDVQDVTGRHELPGRRSAQAEVQLPGTNGGASGSGGGSLRLDPARRRRARCSSRACRCRRQA